MGFITNLALGLGALYIGGIVIPGHVREGEVFTMRSQDGSRTAKIRSCAGGLFGHAHKLIQDKENTIGEKIVFNLEDKNELGHKHIGNNPHTLDLSTGEIIKDVTSTDGFHEHKLDLVNITKNR